MKTIFVLILSLCSLAVHAADTDSAMLRAERFYQRNDFTAAIAEYQSLVDSGYASPALFYNMGNACFKNHDLKRAILFYERAKRLAPNDEDVNENLNLSRSRTFDKVEAVPELFLIVWGRAVRDCMTVQAWSRWSIGAFIALLTLVLLFLFVRNMRLRRIALSLCFVCFAASLATFAFAYLQHANIQRTDEAIVFAPSVTLKSSPDDSGTNVFILHEGVKVRIEGRMGEWCEVRIADGNKGWMRAEELEVI